MASCVLVGALLLVAAHPAAAAAPPPSNILPADYVGPERCRACHAAKFASWSKSYHRLMNQNVSRSAVLADFSGVTVSLEGGQVTFERKGGRHTMTLARGGAVIRRYEVTRTVGSRATQFFIGKQVLGPEPPGHALYQQEHKLPYAYSLRSRRWLPETYFDPDGPDQDASGAALFDPFARPRLHPWTRCVGCHNTLPYVYRLAFPDPLRRGFAPEVLTFSRPAVAGELRRTVDLSRLDPRAPDIRDLLTPERHFVTMGVSCEGCHLGGADHVVRRAPMRFGPISPLLSSTPAREGQRPPAVINGLCAQCHSARVETFPHGGGRVNSREAADLAAGACASKISCTNCHEPHGAGPRSPGRDSARQLASCVGCHEPYRDRARALAHAGTPAHAGVSCLDCHMPRTTQGLDQVIRTHTISSPTDPRMLSAGLANACNVCHLDRPISWTLAALERLWGKRIAADPSWTRVYGGLDRPVGDVWLTSPDHSMRLLAAQYFSMSPLGPTRTAELTRALEDPYPVNRLFAQFALERVTRRKLSTAAFDIAAPLPRRREQMERLISAPPRRR